MGHTTLRVSRQGMGDRPEGKQHTMGMATARTVD